MQPDGSTLGTIVNTPLARSFRAIVTAGWANKSDGDVESPVGHFSLVTIAPNELNELASAVFADDDPIVSPYPGAYIVYENSNGDTLVVEFLSLPAAQRQYDELAKQYSEWASEDDVDEIVVPVGNPWDSPAAVLENRPEVVSNYEDPDPDEKLYLVHMACGESFDDIKIAYFHHCEPQYDQLGGEWDIKPESEAM